MHTPEMTCRSGQWVYYLLAARALQRRWESYRNKKTHGRLVSTLVEEQPRLSPARGRAGSPLSWSWSSWVLRDIGVRPAGLEVPDPMGPKWGCEQVLPDLGGMGGGSGEQKPWAWRRVAVEHKRRRSLKPASPVHVLTYEVSPSSRTRGRPSAKKFGTSSRSSTPSPRQSFPRHPPSGSALNARKVNMASTSATLPPPIMWVGDGLRLWGGRHDAAGEQLRVRREEGRAEHDVSKMQLQCKVGWSAMAQRGEEEAKQARRGEERISKRAACKTASHMQHVPHLLRRPSPTMTLPERFRGILEGSSPIVGGLVTFLRIDMVVNPNIPGRSWLWPNRTFPGRTSSAMARPGWAFGIPLVIDTASDLGLRAFSLVGTVDNACSQEACRVGERQGYGLTVTNLKSDCQVLNPLGAVIELQIKLQQRRSRRVVILPGSSMVSDGERRRDGLGKAWHPGGWRAAEASLAA
ncbi:hypothetical protein JB92DRAFT_2834924 [Gautieria morchelliformis]|nr:hypothetical protein JB92DRAFT_2834924 [Gautieria morchelliformis]